VDQPDGYGAEKSTVESGVLNHDITRLEPMAPERIDVAELWQKRFDVDMGFHAGGGDA